MTSKEIIFSNLLTFFTQKRYSQCNPYQLQLQEFILKILFYIINGKKNIFLKTFTFFVLSVTLTNSNHKKLYKIIIL